MADINQLITLGIGDPADIEHFILVGLNVSAAPPPGGGEDEQPEGLGQVVVFSVKPELGGGGW